MATNRCPRAKGHRASLGMITIVNTDSVVARTGMPNAFPRGATMPRRSEHDRSWRSARRQRRGPAEQPIVHERTAMWRGVGGGPAGRSGHNRLDSNAALRGVAAG